MMRNRRCSCIDTSKNTVNPRSLKDLKQFPPTNFCAKREVIAVLKNGKETCLNPDSEKVKKLIKEWEKKVNQKKKQKKGEKNKKNRKGLKPKTSQLPHQKKTT
ncbi:C-X-C motif chemokine 9 isoform X2 [Erinaceus europaeus]|nr:C-X-C motif chemokine 9 isoform X2 [Erinaceus europaeus]